MSLSLSGGFTPSRYLRPSSGREYSPTTYSVWFFGLLGFNASATARVCYGYGDDDYLMNETRRKPTTGTRCPTLFDKWHGIFYMPSCTDTVGHAKAYIYPVMDHWGESQSALAKGRFEPPTCRSTVEHANHQTRITTPSRRINYTPGPQGESSLGGIICAPPPGHV